MEYERTSCNGRRWGFWFESFVGWAVEVVVCAATPVDMVIGVMEWRGGGHFLRTFVASNRTKSISQNLLPLMGNAEPANSELLIVWVTLLEKSDEIDQSKVPNLRRDFEGRATSIIGNVKQTHSTAGIESSNSEWWGEFDVGERERGTLMGSLSVAEFVLAVSRIASRSLHNPLPVRNDHDSSRCWHGYPKRWTWTKGMQDSLKHSSPWARSNTTICRCRL